MAGQARVSSAIDSVISRSQQSAPAPSPSLLRKPGGGGSHGGSAPGRASQPRGARDAGRRDEVVQLDDDDEPAPPPRAQQQPRGAAPSNAQSRAGTSGAAYTSGAEKKDAINIDGEQARLPAAAARSEPYELQSKRIRVGTWDCGATPISFSAKTIQWIPAEGHPVPGSTNEYPYITLPISAITGFQVDKVKGGLAFWTLWDPPFALGSTYTPYLDHSESPRRTVL